MEMKEVEPGNFALTQLRKIREEVGSDDGIVLVHLLIKLHECLKYLRLSPCVNNSPYFKIIYEALISNRGVREMVLYKTGMKVLDKKFHLMQYLHKSLKVLELGQCGDNLDHV